MRTLLAIYQKLRYNHVTCAYSLTETIVACLAHYPEGEFDHLEGKSAYEQVRFRVDENEDAKISTIQSSKNENLMRQFLRFLLSEKGGFHLGPFLMRVFFF